MGNQLQTDGGNGNIRPVELHGVRDSAIILAEHKLVNDLLKSAMVEGTHYGRPPGQKNAKATLLKPGAEMVCRAFRFVAQYDVQIQPTEPPHREYIVKCTLVTADGELAGAGVGSCSTQESKYAYRWVDSPHQIPQEWWATRDDSILNGDRVKKFGKNWVRQKRVDNRDIADQYNTVLKMAKKRAYVDATLTATAASDMFTQDEEVTLRNVEYEVYNEPQNQPATPQNKTEQKSVSNQAHRPQKERALDLWDKLQGFEKKQVKDFFASKNKKISKDIDESDAKMLADYIQSVIDAREPVNPDDYAPQKTEEHTPANDKPAFKSPFMDVSLWRRDILEREIEIIEGVISRIDVLREYQFREMNRALLGAHGDNIVKPPFTEWHLTQLLEILDKIEFEAEEATNGASG